MVGAIKAALKRLASVWPEILVAVCSLPVLSLEAEMTAHWIGMGMGWGVHAEINRMFGPWATLAVMGFHAIPAVAWNVGFGLLFALLAPKRAMRLAMVFVIGRATFQTWAAAFVWTTDFPFSALIVPLPVVSAWLMVRGRRSPAPGHCQHRGYNLTGNVSGRCPECGERT